MTEQFRDIEKSLSATLSEAARSLPDGNVTVRELLRQIGEQGLLMICVFLSVPFLVPVSLPGVSTVFGLLIVLISVGVTFNRVPWLPGRLMGHRIPAERLAAALEQGALRVARYERLLHPRLLALTRASAVGRFNGSMLATSGLLLMVPFGLVPFSNTLPALATLFLALGMLERDGLFVLLGYLAILGTVVYFAALVAAAVAAGMGLGKLFAAVIISS